MTKVSFVVDKYYYNNLIFDEMQTKLKVRDNIFDKYYKLRDEFKKYNCVIATNDINSIEESDIVIYSDMPKRLPLKENVDKSFLLMMESPLVKPGNFDFEKHKLFRKRFTWSDDLIKQSNYFKIHYAFMIPNKIPKNMFKEKLCCLIVGNKDSTYVNELYSERKKHIKWFEKNYPSDFDLFGVGWNEYFFKGPKLVRVFNRIPLAKKIMFKYFGEFYSSYRGKVDDKFITMQDYKFALCYENIKNESGYVTEKILDPMFAGCVPIYLGADNITEYVPKECFIDIRDFESYEDLYFYINNMDEKEYKLYLNNIESFLNSDDCNKFSSNFFAKTIVNEIMKEFND